jgi:RimJ/RimL family protein N-acetyltransferase/acyl carrier protein
VRNQAMLRPLWPNDYEFLYNLELSVETAGRWRFRGQTPSLEQFVRSLHDGVLTTFVVWQREPTRRCGVVTVYGHDFVAGHAYLAVAGAPEARGTGLMIEGCIMALDHAFLNFPLRKIYIETFEPNLARFASLTSRRFVREAVLKDNVFYARRYWDKIIMSITYEDWRDDVAALEATRASVEISGLRGRGLAFSGFMCALAEASDVVDPNWSESALFLGRNLDSIELFVLLSTVEDLAGATIPNGEIPQFGTFGDLFAWYRANASI